MPLEAVELLTLDWSVSSRIRLRKSSIWSLRDLRLRLVHFELEPLEFLSGRYAFGALEPLCSDW